MKVYTRFSLRKQQEQLIARIRFYIQADMAPTAVAALQYSAGRRVRLYDIQKHNPPVAKSNRRGEALLC